MKLNSETLDLSRARQSSKSSVNFFMFLIRTRPLRILIDIDITACLPASFLGVWHFMSLLCILINFEVTNTDGILTRKYMEIKLRTECKWTWRNLRVHLVQNLEPVSTAARSKISTVLGRSNIGIAGSNPARGMDVCLHCVVLCR
jgi:hypothetical protein